LWIDCKSEFVTFCLPILVALVVVEAALQSINSESGGELDERSNSTIEEDND
jgi:hypothetical protein